MWIYAPKDADKSWPGFSVDLEEMRQASLDLEELLPYILVSKRAFLATEIHDFV
jgi:hypothetical protein